MGFFLDQGFIAHKHIAGNPNDQSYGVLFKMRIGIAIEETWDFFHEIYADLSSRHQTSLFRRRELRLPFFRERVNRYLFNHDLGALIQKNEVVFFEWASHLLAAATHLPKTCGIVTRLHRYEMYQWLDKINWDVVDKIILVSKAKQEEFVSRFPEQAPKTVIIPVGISLDKFQPEPKPFKGDIGILCHLTPRKRVYDLLMTFYELTKKNNGFHLHIAGGRQPSFGDYYFALQDAVKKLGLQDKVTFYGNITDTWNWYHKIDIFISNSYSEGLQVAPIEAIASGCYCLAHWWAGADELLPEGNLYFSSSELQERILNYAMISASEKQAQKDRLQAVVRDRFDVAQTKVRVRQIIEQVGATSRNGHWC